MAATAFDEAIAHYSAGQKAAEEVAPEKVSAYKAYVDRLRDLQAAVVRATLDREHHRLACN